MIPVEVTFDEVSEAYTISQNGKPQAFAFNRELADHIVRFFDRPKTPRDQVIQIIDELIAKGLSRSEAIDHVLTTSDYAGLIRRAKDRQSANPTASRRTINRWLKEHNRESHR